ncbi:hypothetical protein J7L27_03390 [Candidatus Bathyarchaeota archaeon]|nr:hypothetical protein [Candidatus Bathyarchaeota archaeon]
MASIKRGLKSIAKEILESAEKEAEALILRAEAQAEKILEEARKEAERRYNSIIRESRERMKAEEMQLNSIFELEAKNKLLKVKEELIKEVYDETLNRLREYVLTEDYVNCLLRLISEASGRIPSGELEIRLNERDYSRITEKHLLDLSKNIGVKLIKSEKRIRCIGGVVVASLDGKIVIDNTFENRLNSLKGSLRAKIAKILFQEG